MNRKRVVDLLKIAVSLVIIFLIVRAVDLAQLEAVLIGADPLWLIVTVGLVFAGILLRAKRWQILLNVLGVRVPLLELAMIYFIGFFFNNLLPSGLGGDAIRMIELNRHTSRGSDAVTSVVVERMMGLFGSILLAFVTLIFAWQVVPSEIAVVSLVIFFAIIVAGLGLLYKPLYETMRRFSLIRRITDIKRVSNLFASFQDYNLRSLWLSFLIGILFNIDLIAMNVTISLALGIKVPLFYYLVFIPLSSLVLLLPITFAGLGTREATYVYLFTQVGVATEAALALSLLVYVFGNVVPGLVGGTAYLWRGVQTWRVEQEIKHS